MCYTSPNLITDLQANIKNSSTITVVVIARLIILRLMMSRQTLGPSDSYKSYSWFSNISLKNFRGFQQIEDVPLAPLTFLVGPNSSGKSSLFSAILLAYQSDLLALGSITPAWAGPLVDLGSFRDAVFSHKARKEISISLELSDVKFYRYPRLICPMKITVNLKSYGKDPIGFVSSIVLADSLSKQEILIRRQHGLDPSYEIIHPLGRQIWKRKRSSEPHLYYRNFRYFIYGTIEEMTAGKKLNRANAGSKAGLRRLGMFANYLIYFYENIIMQRVASGREGPQRWYPVGKSNKRDGDNWRDEALVFDKVNPTLLTPSQQVPGARAKKKQISIDDLLDQLEIGNKVYARSLSPYHSAISIDDNVTKITSNLIDIGYGASQVIPILSACQSEVKGPLFIEQPEIHMHPKAQASIARLLCQTSMNRQVFVETHSEHMINRARIMVAEGEMPASHVIILYIDRDRRGSKATPIRIMPNGDFDREWPNGFFDERYQDTVALLSLRDEQR